jgi:NADPH:quinone reductase-like Zn-dependent oxidoreductase
MKAALVSKLGTVPVFADHPEPEPQAGEQVVRVAAAALSELVRAQVAGKHYSIRAETHAMPFVPGVDGIGHMDNGRRVYFALGRYPHGAMAERALANTQLMVDVPDALDDIQAAALANPGMSSWVALTRRAHIKPGQVVWVLGAAGTSGRLALPIARHLGAREVIALARDPAQEAGLKEAGADGFIWLGQGDATVAAMAERARMSPPDIILDYLWGEPAAQLHDALARVKPRPPCTHVQIGASAGATASLSPSALRSSDLTVVGSGLGSVPSIELIQSIGELLAAAPQLKLRVAAKSVPLSHVSDVWTQTSDGRIVFVP